MRKTCSGSFFDLLPDAAEDEQVEEVLAAAGFRVERIVSNGQRSPADYWYDQQQDEWVLVLEGQARIEIRPESGEETTQVELLPGDWLFLPAGRLHRVAWTTPSKRTVWLAVHGNTD